MTEMMSRAFAEAFTSLRTAPDSLVRDILSHSSRFVFQSGRQIFKRGDACEGIAFLLSGSIRVYKAGDGSREITLYDVLRGETCILNAACILSDTPYPAHAMAAEGGEALLMPSDDFRRIVEQYAQMRRFVFERLGERLIAVMDLVEEVAFRKLDERLKDYILERSENGVLTTTHQKIAGDLGTSREAVSRVLEDLQRQGLVELSRNQIRIINI